MEVTMKNSTKQQIMDAYLEAKKQLDAIEAMKDDPMTQVAKQNKVKDAEVAGQLIEKHILSAEIESQYQALCNTIAEMCSLRSLKDKYDRIKYRNFCNCTCCNFIDWYCDRTKTLTGVNGLEEGRTKKAIT